MMGVDGMFGMIGAIGVVDVISVIHLGSVTGAVGVVCAERVSLVKQPHDKIRDRGTNNWSA